MIEAGIYHTLTVGRISDYGLYLTDGEENEVLLPNRYVSLENKIGDEIDVFVYHDSEDRLVASTEHPYATVGQVAAMEVVDKTLHGAFLDWGLQAKHLFLPNRNMEGRVEPGRKYVVYVYRDRITGRAVATMSLKGHLSNEDCDLRRGQAVNIIVAKSTPTGYRCVIENRHWGMLYENQLYKTISPGEAMTAYVRKISEDGRIDLSLQKEGYGEVKDSSVRLQELLEENGGFLPVHDDSTPEEISEATGMSKKVFKRSAGFLMKRGVLSIDRNGIRLTAGGGSAESGVPESGRAGKREERHEKNFAGKNSKSKEAAEETSSRSKIKDNEDQDTTLATKRPKTIRPRIHAGVLDDKNAAKEGMGSGALGHNPGSSDNKKVTGRKGAAEPAKERSGTQSGTKRRMKPEDFIKGRGTKK